MAALMDAVDKGDLESVKRLVVEGSDVKERHIFGYTPLLYAALRGKIPIMHWLLTEGGSSLVEKDERGAQALLIAASMGRFAAMQYLLEKQGALITERDDEGLYAWKQLPRNILRYRRNGTAELSSLIKVMVMLEDAPMFMMNRLSPHDAELCTRGRELRAQLPTYLEQQRAAVVTHCPVPSVLQSVVAAYAVTTPEDMWADGLRVQAPRGKRRRTEGE
jgi:ankyrin repeat protein